MSESWPLHPTPKMDELLSDWIGRIAASYGVSYQIFCQRVLCLSRDEMLDLDDKPCRKALEILSKGTGQSIDWLSEMTVAGRRLRAHEALQQRQRRLQEIRDLFEAIRKRSGARP